MIEWINVYKGLEHYLQHKCAIRMFTIIIDQHFTIPKHAFNIFISFHPQNHSVKYILFLSTFCIGVSVKTVIQKPIS